VDRLNVECPPTLLVRIDRLRFDQRLSNLLSNAIKFSPTGSEIQVFTRRNGQRLTVCVRDQGALFWLEVPLVQADLSISRTT